MKTFSLLFIALLVCLPAVSGILAPGEYNGVVIFDRWGACHLFTGVANIEISEEAKEALRPYRGKAVLINAQQIEQPMNPGIGLITKLQVLGPAKSIVPSFIGRPPDVEGLSIRLIPSFPEQGRDVLFIELRNTGKNPKKVDTNALGPLLLTRRSGIDCFTPADGPSYSIVSQWSVALMQRGPSRASCQTDGKGAEVQASLPPGFALSEKFELEAGKSVEIPVHVEASEGEYEFLAGYGGSFVAPSIASNAVDFDVDSSGKAHLTKSSLSLNQVRRQPRVGGACGRVTLDDGRPAAQARVYLWSLPLPKEEPRVANLATTGDDGFFRMEGVVEGLYVLSAARFDSIGIAVGAFGGFRIADATPVSLPDSSTNCALLLAIYPQPTYTVRGRTTAGPGRTTKMILKSGDAFPFESTATVQPDGRYEHRNIPAGRYQFFAGRTGSGFRVDSDIDDLDINIFWPEPQSAASPETDVPPDFYEEMVMIELKAITEAQLTYEKTYSKGFAKTLTVLGPPPTWYHQTADHAGLLSKLGTPFLTDEDAAHFTTSHYRFSYSAGEPDADGKIKGYTVSARPVEFGKTGQRNFFLDESGVIRATVSDSPATKQDPVAEHRRY